MRSLLSWAGWLLRVGGTVAGTVYLTLLASRQALLLGGELLFYVTWIIGAVVGWIAIAPALAPAGRRRDRADLAQAIRARGWSWRYDSLAQRAEVVTDHHLITSYGPIDDALPDAFRQALHATEKRPGR